MHRDTCSMYDEHETRMLTRKKTDNHDSRDRHRLHHRRHCLVDVGACTLSPEWHEHVT